MSFNLCQYTRDWNKGILDFNLVSDEKLEKLQSLAKLALPFMVLYQPLQNPISYGMSILNISSRYKNLTSSYSNNDLVEIAQSVLEIGALALGGLRISLMVTTASELLQNFPKLMDKDQRSSLLMAEAASKALYLLSLISKSSTHFQIASLVTEGCLSVYRAHLLTKEVQQLFVTPDLQSLANNKKGLEGLAKAAMGVIRLYGAYQQKITLTTQTSNQELASFFHQNKQIVIIQNSYSNLQKYILCAGAVALAYRFWEPLAYCLSYLKDFLQGLNSPHLKQMDQNVEEEKEANQTYQEDLGIRQDNAQKFGQTGQKLKEKRAEENQAYEADVDQRVEESQDLIQSMKELEELQIKQDLENRYVVIENEIKRINYELNQDCLVEEIIAFNKVQMFFKQIEDLIQDHQSSNLEDKEEMIETLENVYRFFQQIIKNCPLEEESDSSDELNMSSDSDISSGADSPPSSPITSPILTRSSTFKQEIELRPQILTIEQKTSSFTNSSASKIIPLEIPQPKTTQASTSSLDQISNPILVLNIPSPQVIEQIRNNLEETIEHQAPASDTQTVIIEPKVVVVESSNNAKENITLSFVKKTSSENSQEKTVQKTTQVFAQKEKANVQEEIDLNLEFYFPSIPSLTPLQTAEKETEKAEIELRKIEEAKLKKQATAKSLVQTAKELLAETAWMNLDFDPLLEDQLKLSIDQANLLLSSLEWIPEEKEIKNLNNKIEELRASISNLKEEIAKFNSEIAILEQAKVKKLTSETKLSIADPNTEAKILAKSTKDSKVAIDDLQKKIVELTSDLNRETTLLTARLNAKMQLLKKLTHDIEEKTTQLISEKERLQVVITKIEADHLKAFKDLSKERIKKPVVALSALRQLAKYDNKLAKNLVEAQNIKDRTAYLDFYTTEINKLEKTVIDSLLIQSLRENFLPILNLKVMNHIRSYLPSVEQVRLTQVTKIWKEKGKSAEVKQCYLLIKELKTLIPNLNVTYTIKHKLWSQYYRLLAHLNLKRAIEEANQIKGSFWTSADKYRDPALLEIAKVTALTNLVDARKIASMIKDPSQKTNAFVEIAKIDPLHILTKAQQLANDEYHQQDILFLKIATIEALADLDFAKLKAEESKSADYS